MSSKPSLLLTTSACAYLAVSLALIFAGDDLLRLAGPPRTLRELALLHLLGAALFSLGLLNWMNRFSRIGGIFGRPLVAANLANGMIAALMMLQLVRTRGASALLLSAFAFNAILAVAFGLKMYRPPTPDDL